MRALDLEFVLAPYRNAVFGDKCSVELTAKCRIAPGFPTPGQMAVGADQHRKRSRAVSLFESAIGILIHRQIE